MTKSKSPSKTTRSKSQFMTNSQAIRHQRLADKVRVLQARVDILESSFGKSEEE